MPSAAWTRDTRARPQHWRRSPEVVEAIPPHRLTAPDSAVWGEAGVLGGLLFRLGGHAKGQERACLNDALIYLQARRLGCIVLTANIADFDRLNQLVPNGRVLFYRAA